MCDDVSLSLHLMMWFILCVVMVMGFSEREGRLGLRATNGDMTKAIQHIIEKRKVRTLQILSIQKICTGTRVVI